MENARRDENGVPTLLGVLDSDGETVIRVKANPSTNVLAIEDSTTGSDNGPENAKRDENSIPTLLAISSADGVTPIPVYVNIDGKLLVDSS